jgi:hypothetical protein
MSIPEADVRQRAAEAVINDTTYTFKDPVPDVRQMLNTAEFTPADECVLIQVFAHGARALGLDETVDLRQAGIENFWAFHSDRVFRFTLDERGFEWGEAKISEPRLRQIGHVGDVSVIVLERDEEPDLVLKVNDFVTLGHEGTEHLRTKSRLITVFFNDAATEIPRGTYTTEELDDIFGVEPGYVLNVKDKDGQLQELKKGEHTHVKEGMRFYSQVPCGGTS